MVIESRNNQDALYIFIFVIPTSYDCQWKTKLEETKCNRKKTIYRFTNEDKRVYIQSMNMYMYYLDNIHYY